MCGCAGWSAPCCSQTPKDRFSRVEAHIKGKEHTIDTLLVYLDVLYIYMVCFIHCLATIYIYWLCVFSGELGKAPSLPTDTLPAQKEPEGATAAPNEEEEEDLMGRLEALRS